jgi:hypothetical protein
MGEIRVEVPLTNSMDEALHRRKKLKKSAVRRYEADAMVEMGPCDPIVPTGDLRRTQLILINLCRR